jgi:hypothetical protein
MEDAVTAKTGPAGLGESPHQRALPHSVGTKDNYEEPGRFEPTTHHAPALAEQKAHESCGMAQEARQPGLGADFSHKLLEGPAGACLDNLCFELPEKNLARQLLGLCSA